MIKVDVLIVGGGPAGSTAAALLAREGRSVVVVEREKFPRYHIGESLLAGVLPFLDELGAREAVEARAFQRKTGQTFIWGKDRSPWQIDFKDLDVYPYSYFVERADFDDILLRNAERLGARALERHSVAQFAIEDGRVVGADVEDPDGAPLPIRAAYTIDASGQAALLARKFNLRKFQRGLRNLAIWSYWEGAGRLPKPADEHIFTVSIEDGWIWFIPLRGGITSVGVVTSDWTRRRREREGSPEVGAWYHKVLRGCEPVQALLSSAREVDGVRVQRDWSYRSSRFCGPGYLLAGDAACFVDPILSTGVNLAMNAGYLAALATNSALAEPEKADAFMHYFEQAYRTLFDEQLASIKHFYKVEARRESVYWKSKQILRVDQDIDGALSFLFINSGLARHATAASPHQVPAQARALFASHIGKEAAEGASGYEPRAAKRRLVPDGDLVFVEGNDRRLYGVVQSGMRLELRPHAPRGLRGRPPGTAALLEIESRPDKEPVGWALIERERPDVDPRIMRARGFCVSTRAYSRGTPADRLLGEAASEIASLISSRAEASIPDLVAGLRRDIEARLEPRSRWALASAPTRLRGVLVEQPVVAEITREGTLWRIWLVLRPRRPPGVVDAPFARTRFVDIEYRLGADAPDEGDVAQMLGLAARQIREAVRGKSALSEALAACEEHLTQPAWLPAGFRVVRLHRVEPPEQG